MTARTLPTHDLKLIDDRRLTYQGQIETGPFLAAAFVAEDGMGVIVSIETQTPDGEAYHLSVTRPDRPPTDDDLAVVRIAVCGPGSQARIVTPEDTPLAGRIVHLLEEPAAYAPPDAPWWTPDEFEAFAVTLARQGGTPPERATAAVTTLEQLGLVRVARRQDPERGAVVQLDLRALFWREERRRQRAAREG